MDERTIEILKRFSHSWSDTEEFYDNLIENYSGFERLKPIRKFIHTLKLNGEEKFFRLGTSIHILIISRSVENRLRQDQKHIKVDTFDNKFEVTLRDGNKVYRQYRVDNLNHITITKLLNTLRNTLVD